MAAATSASISTRSGRILTIDAVGIDNYMPLSDWRDADIRAAIRTGFDALRPGGLRAGDRGRRRLRLVLCHRWPTAGADAHADHRRRLRQAMGVSLQGPGLLVVAPHHNRKGGVEEAPPTAWVPRSKPIWFTELGCPAIDKGPNQPNVFSDPKSAENAMPYFSSGGRSDLAPARFLEAHFAHWDPASEAFEREQSDLADLWRAHGRSPADLCLGVGCAALSGISAAHRSNGRTARTGSSATG